MVAIISAFGIPTEIKSNNLKYRLFIILVCGKFLSPRKGAMIIKPSAGRLVYLSDSYREVMKVAVCTKVNDAISFSF